LDGVVFGNAGLRELRTDTTAEPPPAAEPAKLVLLLRVGEGPPLGGTGPCIRCNEEGTGGAAVPNIEATAETADMVVDQPGVRCAEPLSFRLFVSCANQPKPQRLSFPDITAILVRVGQAAVLNDPM
jgi:hypothetical protein